MTIHNIQIEQLSSYKYVGVYVDAALSWSAHIDYLVVRYDNRFIFFGDYGHLEQIRRFCWCFSNLLYRVLCNMECVHGIVYLSVQFKARLARLLSICSKLWAKCLR